MTHRAYRASAVILVVAFPALALADASGSVTIPANMNFSFDNGTVTSSGGDIRFTGPEIAFAGTATGVSLGALGAVIYSETGPLSSNAWSSTPIISLAPGEIFFVRTNRGNVAKVLLISVSGAALQLQWYTYGSSASGSTPLPTISEVAQAGWYSAGGVTQGSMFVVKGSNLSASGFVQTSFPLPPSSGGVSVAFTQNGAPPVPAYLVYLYNQGGVNQLAAVAPSTLAPGLYELIVSNNGPVAVTTLTVVAAQPELFTQDSTGEGLASVQNYVSSSELDVNRFTTGVVNGSYISPAHPGQTLVAWLTGLGPIAGADNLPAPAYNFAANGANVQVWVGGISITPFYAGRAPGLAGVDQINFTLPGNVPTGCKVGIQIEENGVLTSQNLTFLSIAPSAAATDCVQPGYSTAVLQALDNGATLTAGAFSITQQPSAAASELVTGRFTASTGFELPNDPIGTATPGCTVTQVSQPWGILVGGGASVPLDAGTIILNGPSGSGFSNVALPDSSGSYDLIFAGQLATISGQMLAGTYTLTGSGGKDVGPFSATVSLPTPLTVINFPSMVNRSSGLTLNWTGGNPSDLVAISGTASSVENGVETGASFVCNTTAETGTFTVPASILNQLPAASVVEIAPNLYSGAASLGVTWTTTPSGANGWFSAPLTGGGTLLNGATFTGSTSVGTAVVFQ